MSATFRCSLMTAAILLASAPPCRAGAGIATDGSVGAATTIAGANAGRGTFQIPQNLGRLAGGNLFHSFSVFDVDTGQTARFTTTSAGIANVVSRVTGGAASRIDGLLQLAPATGSAPNFFFINPAGVAFGSGASIDVPAAFHVSTADYLKFPDGEFHADPARASTFSSAAPEAFGFLGTTQAQIGIGRTEITTQQNRPIGIVGGSVAIDGGGVYSQGGEIRIAAVGKAAREIGLAGDLPSLSGSLELKNGATVDATHQSGGKGGDISVSGGSVRIIDGATVWSDSYYGSAAGGDVDVKASSDLLLANGGQISSTSIAAGNTGSVKVRAGGNIVVDDDDAGRYTGILAYAWLGSGNAGNVEVSAGGDVSVLNGASVHSMASGAGAVGDVKVSGRAVRVAGVDAIIKAEATTWSTSGRIGNVSVTATESLTVADYGAISIPNGAVAAQGAVIARPTLAVSAPDVTIRGGGRIDTTSSGNIDAAGVAVTATRDVSVSDAGYVASLAYASGNAGPLEIKAGGDLNFTAGGRVTSGTYGAGAGGKVTVDATNITIDGAGRTGTTGLGSVVARSAQGSGGDIDVTTTGRISIADRGEITSITYGGGRGGTVDVRAGEIVIDGGGYDYATGINAHASTGTGGGGEVRVDVRGALSIANGGGISSKTFSDGKGGSIALGADSIAIDGRGGEVFTGITSGADAEGDGGNLDIVVGKTVGIVGGGKISASTAAAGNAGNLSIEAGGDVTVDGQGIATGILNQTNGSGSAGNIAVSTQGRLAILEGGKISGSAFSSGTGGSIRLVADEIVVDGRANGMLTAIVSDTNGDGAAGGIDISAAGRLSLAKWGGIVSRAYAAGAAGEVTIRAKDVEVAPGTEISTAAMAGSSGNAGTIRLTATGDLTILEDGTISSSTRADGNAGSVTVDAANIVIDGKGALGGIFSNANSNSKGKAGSIDIAASGTLSVLHGAQISSSTWAAGDAGAVKVDAGAITIDGKGQTSGIFSSANEESSAKAGSIDVVASGALSVADGGQISSATWAPGPAGSVKIDAGSIVVGGGGAMAVISSNANGGDGAAGSVDVVARGAVSVLDGGRISSSTYSVGHAGSVKVGAASVLVDGRGTGRYTGISSSAVSGSGDAGTVELATPGELSIADGGVVESKTETSGQAGLVKVQAGSIAIAGQESGISSDAAEGSQGNAGGIGVSVARTLSIASGGYISSSTSGSGNAGTVDVKAGSLAIDGKGVYTGIYSGTAHGGRGGDIDVAVTGDIDMKAGAVIVGSTGGAGDAGSIRISARNISIDGSNSIEFDTGIQSSSYVAEQGTSGNAGRIAVNADTVWLTKNGRISSNTLANGRGGEVTLDVRHLRLTEGGNIDSEAEGTGNAGDIVVRAAEDVVIDGVGNVRGWLANGEEVVGQFSAIFLNTAGTGNGGSLQLTTPRLTISDGGSISAIANDGRMANLPDTRAGNIRIDAGTVVLSDGGGIGASTSGAGMAGSISIDASEGIAISGKFDRSRHPEVTNPKISDQSGIDSRASYALNPDAKTLGIGGNIAIATPVLALARGGEIVTSTEGAGRAGSIDIKAGTVTVDGAGSRIDASATATSAGQTGSVGIRATNAVRLSDGGTLSVTNDATVDDPAALTPTLLAVSAPFVTLRNASITAAAKGNVSASDVRIDFTERLFLDPSSITTSAVGGNGGAITIAGGGSGVIVLENSQITTSTQLGNGGPISINARSLVLNTGFVVANAENGPAGGTVNIDVRTLVPSGNTLFKGGQTLQDFTPGVFGYNVIQAAAPSGLGGTVQITAPALDISGALTGLSAQLLDAGGLGRSPCDIGGGSSLVQAGRGGFAPSARDLLGPAPAMSPAAAPAKGAMQGGSGGPLLAYARAGCSQP